MFHVTVARSSAFSVAGPMAWNALLDSIRDTALSISLLFQTLSEDSSFLLVLAHQNIRGFAFMRYINPRLTLTLSRQAEYWLPDCGVMTPIQLSVIMPPTGA